MTKKMTGAKTLRELFPCVNARIIDFLIDDATENPDKEYTRLEIADGAKIHYRSCSMVFAQLEKLGIIKHTRNVGRKGYLQLFQLNGSDLAIYLTKIKNELLN